MKILFINPPLHNFLGGCHSETTPLGLMYLAAVLEKNNYSVKILDAERLLLSWEDLKQKIINEKPDLIGIGGTSLSLPALCETAKIIRRVLPNIKIIAGGRGVTYEPERVLKENPAINLVVMHEAEKTILEIMQHFNPEYSGKNLSDIKGIAFRENNPAFAKATADKQIIINQKQEYIEELDTIPFPAYHLLEPSFSHYSGMHRGTQLFQMKMPNAVIMASRGCPHRCIFCSGGQVKNRRRDPKKIVNEVEFCYKQIHAKSIQFYDDEFVGTSPAQNQWIQEICDEIIKRKLTHLSYLVQGRCSKFIDLPTLKKMKQAGFKWIWWGVESGSQKVLDLMKKDTTVQDIKNSFKLAKEAGIKSLMFIIVGIPGETKEDVFETGKLIERIKPDQVRFHIITPFPGSELWETLKAKDQIEDYNFLHYNTRFSAVHHTDEMSKKEIEEIYNMMILRYESNKKNLIKVLFKSLFSLKGLKKLPNRIKKMFKYIPQWIKMKSV
ncbi:B12-binding domain-containing radical SAM protein [Patescibacteria group bacterium]|nr:B12-binding domain-containing radical SAM protein [Patescibacteria group bacterium]